MASSMALFRVSLTERLYVLFDHLVGAGEHCRRNVDAEHLRRLQVDDQLEFGCSHDWQIGGLLALEHATRVQAGLALPIEGVRSVAHQSASLDELAVGIHRRHGVARRLREDLRASAEE